MLAVNARRCQRVQAGQGCARFRVMTSRVSLAGVLSIAFHPFVTSLVLVGGSAWPRATRAQAAIAMVAVLASIVPVAVLMLVQVRRGRWSNADASNASERPLLFSVALVALAAVMGWLAVRDPGSHFLRGASLVLGMLVVAAVATRWIKLSLHVAFAALTATVLSLSGSMVGYAMILAVPAVAWSRLALARHSRAELSCGALLGVATALATVYL